MVIFFFFWIASIFVEILFHENFFITVFKD